MTEKSKSNLRLLNYHQNWLEFGFLTIDNLTNQVISFDNGDDKNTEHFRYQSFLDFINAHQHFTNTQMEQFIILVNQDVDNIMAESALRALYLSGKLTDNQVTKVENSLIEFGNWAKRLVEINRKLP